MARLLEFGKIRVLADRLGVDSIDREKHLLIMKFREDAPIDPVRLVGIVQTRADVTLTPPGTLGVDLGAQGALSGRTPRRRLDSESTSWWTARATTGTNPYSGRILMSFHRHFAPLGHPPPP